MVPDVAARPVFVALGADPAPLSLFVRSEEIDAMSGHDQGLLRRIDQVLDGLLARTLAAAASATV